MKILGIDGGSEKSAIVFWDPEEEKILQASIVQNYEALELLRCPPEDARRWPSR
jgi:hypothetical protein